MIDPAKRCDMCYVQHIPEDCEIGALREKLADLRSDLTRQREAGERMEKGFRRAVALLKAQWSPSDKWDQDEFAAIEAVLLAARGDKENVK